MIDALKKVTSKDWEVINSKDKTIRKKMTPRIALLSLLSGLEDEHWGLSDYYEEEYEVISKALDKLETLEKAQ